MSFIQIYKILTSYVYFCVILLSNRDKIKGYLPTLKETEFFFHSCFYKKHIHDIMEVENAQ